MQPVLCSPIFAHILVLVTFNDFHRFFGLESLSLADIFKYSCTENTIVQIDFLTKIDSLELSRLVEF